MSEDRFQRVVQAAWDLFGTKGYAATGMRDIAQSAALAPVQLYRLGLSKEDLLAEVSIRLTDHQLRHITSRARPRHGESTSAFVARYLLSLYRSDIRHLAIRRETAAYGWMWSPRHEQRIVGQVVGLLQPIEAAVRAAGLSEPSGRLYTVWALYYVGFRHAVVAGAGPHECLERIRPSLNLALA
jgi:AcrR family transcriptional regulator